LPYHCRILLGAAIWRPFSAMAKSCIFCGGGGPFSNEHVIPEWAAKVMKLKRVRVTPRKLGVAHKPYESVGSFGTTIGSVCKVTCNTGWMSELERLVQPILTPMMIPKAVVSISPDEQVVLASWLWKLAIVAEYPTGAVYFKSGIAASDVQLGGTRWLGVVDAVQSRRRIGGETGAISRQERRPVTVREATRRVLRDRGFKPVRVA